MATISKKQSCEIRRKEETNIEEGSPEIEIVIDSGRGNEEDNEAEPFVGETSTEEGELIQLVISTGKQKEEENRSAEPKADTNKRNCEEKRHPEAKQEPLTESEGQIHAEASEVRKREDGGHTEAPLAESEGPMHREVSDNDNSGEHNEVQRNNEQREEATHNEEHRNNEQREEEIHNESTVYDEHNNEDLQNNQTQNNEEETNVVNRKKTVWESFWQRRELWVAKDFIDYQDWTEKLNKFFVFIAFIGVPLTVVATRSLSGRAQCNMGPKGVIRVISFGVFSFLSFGISIIRAGLTRMRTRGMLQEEPMMALLRKGFLVSQLLFASGLFFLFLTVEELAQVRLGRRSCSTEATAIFWVTLCTLGSMSVFWVLHTLNVFFRH